MQDDSVVRLERRFRVDERCRAMFLWGSLGAGTADAFSDVDAAIVVRDRDYGDLRAELKSVCEAECGPLALWLPEADAEGFCSIAFLYEAGEELLLYDFQVIAEGQLSRRLPRRFRVLFDHDGLLEGETAEPASASPGPERVSVLIDTWWVYCFLNGKYFQRRDLYKLLYVQQVLFRTHLELLLRSEGVGPLRWWPSDLRKLPADLQAPMLVYFSEPRLSAVTRAIAVELDLFATSARIACERNGVAYPDALEQGVRTHLSRLGVWAGVA